MTVEKKTNGRVARKRQARIEEILRTAARLFAKRGYHATSVEDIANELDLQKGSLYHYFASKDALLNNIVKQQLNTAVNMIREILAVEESPKEKFKRAVHAHLHLFNQHADIYSIFKFENLSLIDPALARTVDKLSKQYELEWRKLLRMGVDAGDFRPGLDTSLMVKGFEGLLNSSLTWFRSDGRLSLDEVADQFVELMLGGIVIRE